MFHVDLYQNFALIESILPTLLSQASKHKRTTNTAQTNYNDPGCEEKVGFAHGEFVFTLVFIGVVIGSRERPTASEIART